MIPSDIKQNIDFIQTSSGSSSDFGTFKAAYCTELGKPLQVEEKPFKLPIGNNEVLISVKTAGVNFADILMCQGKYQVKSKVPFIPGTEIAGVIVAVGEDVKTLSKGDRVMAGSSMGAAFATLCLCEQEHVWRIPDKMSFKEAVALLVCYGTSMLSVARKAKVKPGETVLVTAAAGATGLAAVDIAANMFNAKVIAACGSDEKCLFTKSKGAMYTINYTKENVRKKLREITLGEGVNVVIDHVGGDLFLDCLKSLSDEGRMVTIGYTSGKIPQIPANLVLLKSATITGAVYGDYKFKDINVFRGQVDDSLEGYKQGRLHPQVGESFSLSQINEAFAYVMTRKSAGKVIIDMES